MGRARYADVVTDPDGRPVAGTIVDVFNTGTTTAVAGPIYAAATGAGTLANPFTIGTTGEFEFYLAVPARVDLRYTKSGYTAETHTVDVLDADHGHSAYSPTAHTHSGAYVAQAAGYMSGAYYGPPGAATTTRAYTADNLRLVPYLVRSAQTFDRIAIETTTAGGAGMVYRLGIFNHNPVTGRPGTVLLDAGTVVGDAVAGAQEKTISQLLDPGWYWLAAAAQVFSGTPALRAFTGCNPLLDLPSAASGTAMSVINSFSLSGITGAFTSLAGLGAGAFGLAASAPCILLRAA